jgi:hypothetical protein
MKRRTKIVVLGSVLLLTAGAASAATASETPRPREAAASEADRPREAAALTGTAKLYRSAGDDITFSFDAHLAAKDGADPMKATGTFSFSHYRNGDGARAEVAVDCLLTGGKVAVVSGIVTESDLPGAEGKRVGVTVHDSAATTGSATAGPPRALRGDGRAARVRELRPLREGREGDGRLHGRALAARVLTSARAVTR